MVSKCADQSAECDDELTRPLVDGQPKWRKILYEKQPFEDNYVDVSFLEQLRTNANVQDHDYWGMVRSAAAISQQLCAMLIFFSIFSYIETGALSVETLALIDVVLAVSGFLVLRIYFHVPLMLRTLTRSYADDTISALAVLLALVHIISHDYCYVNSGIGRFSGTISLNAAIFTAVLLGSRLHSNEQVFAFILLAIEIFAVFPMFQREVKRNSESTHLGIAVALFALSAVLSYPISVVFSSVSSLFVLFVTFVCPLWFMHVQEYKNEILGPWDIVHVQAEQ